GSRRCQGGDTFAGLREARRRCRVLLPEDARFRAGRASRRDLLERRDAGGDAYGAHPAFRRNAGVFHHRRRSAAQGNLRTGGGTLRARRPGRGARGARGDRHRYWRRRHHEEQRMIHASAPGKLFITGEYAVLERAPAWLTAVDVRAHCRMAPAEGKSCTLHALPVASSPLHFSMTTAALDWQGESSGVVDAAWQALSEKRREMLAATAW